MTSRVVFATCEEAPGVDVHDEPLVAALAALDVEVETRPWTDGGDGWRDAPLVLLRSTWDYPDHHEEFLAWLDLLAEQGVAVMNPRAAVRWNSDKRYLGRLAGSGIPIVPTRFISPGEPVALPRRGEVVVKPAVSAGSRETARYDVARELMTATGHVQRLLAAGRTVMVQPYVPSVDERGETALIHTAGRFSHAIGKGPLLGAGAAPTDLLYAPEEITPRTPSAAELDLAEAVLSALPRGCEKLLYARVDLVDGSAGEPLLLELELIEPSLFLGHAPPAEVARLAEAIAALL